MEKYIYKALTEFEFTQPAALCSVVDSKGSVPRKDYPYMLVLADKKTIGTVGGGHLEHKVSQQAQNVLQTGEPQLLHFEMTGNDPNATGGLCGGTAQVLVEVFTPVLQDQFRNLGWDTQNASPHTVLTHFDTETGTVNRIWDWDTLGDGHWTLIHTAKQQGEFRMDEAPGHWYRQLLTPPPVLHIFGAGHVGQSVAQLAHFLDLDVAIYDDRNEMTSEERFPNAILRKVDTFEQLIEDFVPATSDYVMVMTKGHAYDYQLMQRLLTLDIDYLGLMASQRKWDVLRKALLKDGFTVEQLNAVHAPLGLDIGGETVPEIAVSIMAEVVNHLRKQHRSSIALTQTSLEK